MAYIRKTSDNNMNVVLSGNAGKIEYLLDDENDSIKLTVGSLSDVKLNALIGVESTLDLAEILESVPLNTTPMSAGLYKLSGVTIQRFRYNPGTKIDSLQQSISFVVLKGYIFRKGFSQSEYNSILQGQCLTQREQVSTTYKEFPELLSVLCDSHLSGTSFQATLTAYRSNGSTSNVLLGSISPSTTGYYVWTFQAGWNLVKTIVSNPSNVTGWKIVVTSSRSGSTSVTLKSIRFNFGKERYQARCFAFRNDLGGIDTIHTLGSFRTLPSSDQRVFVNDGSSRILNMNPVTEYEAESGPIENAVQREKWKAFLRSPAKYIYTKADQFDSDAGFVPILLTESSPKLTDWELNSVTFKFRHEYERGGRVFKHE